MTVTACTKEITCKKCGSIANRVPRYREREIITLKGKMELVTQLTCCTECASWGSVENPFAPKGSRYGWDVINRLKEIDAGRNAPTVASKLFLAETGISLPVSSVHELLNRY